MNDIQITTHNKNYTYKINNKQRLIEYINNPYQKDYPNSFIPICTGMDIISSFTTMDDLYLFCISEKVVYLYDINQSNGTLLLFRKHNACFLQSLLNECYNIKEKLSE